ncbi:MAG: tRNA (5-methylaminomethyl-2-thiouridine)(34)-methyltransferase MnmD [Jejuia sp.]
MKREIITTADGSTTIHLPDWNEQYHSKHGAIQEAYHVFIKHGLHHVCHPELVSGSHQELSILEIGFGTGLNAFITYLEAEKSNLKINYVGVEGYPVSPEEVQYLNYSSELKAEKKDFIFKRFHDISWEDKHQISTNFNVTKQQKLFHEIEDKNQYHLIYFDAFGARVQPELWTETIFKKMYDALKEKGVLVTYAAKGSVRRAMQSVGFLVEKLPGPPGKREMLRATR